MRFSDLTINNNLKNSLNALEASGRVPHAVIIKGGSITLRKSLADHLSAWAVCSGAGDKPCGLCKNCKNAMSRHHSDIYYAVGSGKTGIYNANELKSIIHDTSVKPNQAHRKVYVFEDCDKKLSEISQNILLKTLEEPPQDIIFILTCENSKILLQTIRSRAFELALEDQHQIDEQSFLIAEDIISGILSPSEINLLRAASKLSDRFTAIEALDATELILNCGISSKTGFVPEENYEIAQNLCRKLTKMQFLKLIDITSEAIKKINQNVSLALVSTWLCSQYRKAVWQ